MKQGTCVEIELPLPAIIHFLLQAYPHLVTHPDLLKNKLEKLKPRCGGEKVSHWYKLIDTGNWEIFVQDILEFYYDPIYSQSIKSFFGKAERLLSISNLSDNSIHKLLNSLLPN